MANRRVLYSHSYSALTGSGAAFLEAQSRGSEVVLLASTRAAADEFARATCAGGWQGVHRFTLAHFAAQLATVPAAERNLAPLGSLAAEALAARVVHRLSRAGELSYFGPVARMPGFARALARTLAELRHERTDPAALARSGAPGADLARLLVLYESELRERGFADFATLLRLATETARDGRHRLLGLPLALIDIPLDTALHRDFVAALSARSPAVFAAALAGDTEAVNRLERILHVTPEPVPDDDASSLARLRRYLFAAELPEGPPFDSTVDFFSAPGESLECAEIARGIRRLAAEGTAFDRTAILLRSPERYQPLVEEALRRAAIPAWFSRGSARPDPAGRAFLALLACAGEGCSATRFAEYLSLGQTPLEKQEREWTPPEDELIAAMHRVEPVAEAEPREPEDPHAPVLAGTVQAPSGWEKLLVDAAVVGGRDRWKRRLRGLEREFKLKYEPGDWRVQQLANLEKFALPLIERLDSLPARAPWGEWLAALGELAESALRRPDSVLAVLNEMQPMDEVGPVDLDEVYGVLADRLRFLRREPPLRRYGRVFVGSVEEVRGRSFDVVFLPGLAEGLFPRRAFEDPLLLDHWRRELGENLPVQDDRVARERLLLRTAAAAARKRLVASYPRMDEAQSRPRVPSFYALEIVRAGEGRLPDLRDFERRASVAGGSRLGWPAPREARDAIDAAEYDLAVLDRAVEKGSGRYLTGVNEALARSLRARYKRWNIRAWSEEDGLVQPDAATLRVLENYRLANRAYSPTALQQYAACPYKFLLYGVLGLRVREEPVALEEMDPLTRGSLFHAIQYAIYRAIEREGAEKIWEIAKEVFPKIAAEYEEALAPAIPRVWKSELEDLRCDVRGWLKKVIEMEDWKPFRYEYAFGPAPGTERDPRSSSREALLPGGVRLRGSIDLVEQHAERDVLRVTDHKTGKLPLEVPRYTGGGSLLQPLLYALAAGQLLEKTVECGRLFYCTERGGYQEFEFPVNDDARRRITHVLDTIDQAISTGFLPAAPAKDACKFCDYRAVCGPYEEERARRKHPDRLEPLVELRAQP